MAIRSVLSKVMLKRYQVSSIKSSHDIIALWKRDFGFSSPTEKIVYWIALLTPLWWLLGIQPLFYPAVIAGLLLRHLNIVKIVRKPFPVCIWAWLLMALVMLWTALLGLAEMDAGLRTVAAAVVTFGKSYLLIFACLALPFLTPIRSVVVTRAVAWMAAGFSVNLAVQLGLLALGVNNVSFKPLLARLIPGEVSSSLMVSSASTSDFFGMSLPRSVLHTADPPILGVVALLCFLIVLNEPQRKLRYWAITAAGSALVISFSRLSWVCFLLAVGALLCFQHPKIRQFPLWLAAIAFSISSIFELTWRQLLQTPRAIFDGARASSSSERSFVVQKTLEAWQKKPWAGWGVIRGEVWLYDDTYITLGSFSTYSAVLYLNGIVGFLFFIAALAVTLWAFCKPALQGNFSCQLAFVGFSLLCILIQATPLSWMAIYLWFFFVWMGAVLKEVTCQENSSFVASTPVADWEQLVVSSVRSG